MIRPYDPAEPLFSLHVPKTAGTSLRLSLQTWFPKDRLLLHYQDTTTLEMPKRHDVRGPVCIHGHFEAARGYGVDAYYPEARQFMVFLRDPFERAVSLYSFIRMHQERRADMGLLDRMFKRKPLSGAGFMPFEDWIPFLLAEQAEGRGTTYPWFLPGAPDIEAVQRAMTERFVFVGITENYERSLDALAAMLGKKKTTARFVNRTSRPAQDFERWRADHVAAFPEEYALYDTAVRLNRTCLATYA